MYTTLIAIIVGIICIVLGFLIAKYIAKKKASSIVDDAKAYAKTIVNEGQAEAENIKNQKILQAKEKFIELKAEHEKHIEGRNRKIGKIEHRVKQKESRLNKEISKTGKLNKSLSKKEKDLNERLGFIETKQNEIEKIHGQKVKQLEVISGLNADEAKAQLVETLKESARTEAMAVIQNTIEEAKLSAKQEARRIIINTIQRVGAEESIDNCVSVFN